MHVLADRRAACEDLGASMAESWNAAIDRHDSFEVALLLARSTDENELRIARSDRRKQQIATLFGELGEKVSPEIKSLLLDIASQVEGLCSIAQEPSGFSLMSFNEKRSELRVELDKSTSRASLQIPPVHADARMELLDSEVETEQGTIKEANAKVNKAMEAEKQAKEEAAAAKKREEHEAAAAAQQREAQQQRQREAEDAAGLQAIAEIRNQHQPVGTWWDERTGLLWTPKDNGADITWDLAKAHCDNLTLGGSDNWRLPSMSELEGLYDPSSPAPYKTRSGVELGSFWAWSSELKSDDSTGAWNLGFVVGGRHWSYREASNSVRALCVRRPGE